MYGNLSQALGGSGTRRHKPTTHPTSRSISCTPRTSRGRHSARGRTAAPSAAPRKGFASRAPTTATSTSPRTDLFRARQQPSRQHRPARSTHWTSADLRIGHLGIRQVRLKGYDKDRVLTRSDGLHRIDIVPAIRFPFNKLAFLALNATVRFPNTFWSDSLPIEATSGPDGSILTRLDRPITRRFLEFGASVNGPTLVRSGTHQRAGTPSDSAIRRAFRVGYLSHLDRQLRLDSEAGKLGQDRRRCHLARYG